MKYLIPIFTVICFCHLSIAQNSYPTYGPAVLNSGGDVNLALKDSRPGINWNYIVWQFNDGGSDWVLGRKVTNGYFTLIRSGVGDVLTVNNSGNVGIGTNNPLAKLHVTNGVIQASDPNFNDINVRLDGTGIPVIRFTRYTGTPSVYHNAFVGQFYDADLGSYSLGIGTGASTTGDQNATTNVITIPLNGNVGIGTNSPDGFQVNKTLDGEFSRGVNNVRLGVLGGSPRIILDNIGSTPFEIDNASGRFRIFNPGIERFTITSAGNVGIGTTSPTEKLTVNGTVYSKEVRVDLNVQGPDYVFEPSYKLPSLEELQNYINQNKHLPEVPSAKEMEQNGINVGEMNMILLKKVEELTLYVIEQNKKLEEQQKQIQNLQNCQNK